MTDSTVRINGFSYQLARQGKAPSADSGPRMFSITARPSIPTDPSLPTQVIEWQPWGANLISFEVIAPGDAIGYLGVDYGVDTDSRWDGINTLAPALTTVDLSGTGGTAATTNCAELSTVSMNAGGARLYVGRGTRNAKINPATMARVAEASPTTMAANIKDLLYTRSANGTEEIAVALGDANAYRVITAVGTDTSGSDTYSSAPTAKYSKWLSSGLGADGRVFGATGATASTPAELDGNILTGSVTMASPTWIKVASLAGDNVTIGSLGLDGNFVCVGTNGGLYTLDPQYSSFRPIDPETEVDASNCIAMGSWMAIGTLFNLARSMRFIKWGSGASCGTEVFLQNTSPISGRMTAVAGTDRWLYAVFYNEVTGDSYLCALRPRQPGEPHSNPLSIYTLRKLASTSCLFARHLGTVNGVRTLPTLVIGYGTDIAYMNCGRTARWPDDTSYTYATSGTTYLTEARRDPGMIKDVEAVELETAGCASGKTVTVGISFDGAAAVNLSAVTTNGYQRLLPVSGGVPLAASTWTGRRLKPQIAYTSDSASAAPSVVGKIRVLYRARPIMTKQLQFGLYLPREKNGQSLRDAEASLLTAWGAGPVAIEDIESSTAYYARIDSVSITEVLDSSSDVGHSAGAVRVATVRATVWPTASGQ